MKTLTSLLAAVVALGLLAAGCAPMQTAAPAQVAPQPTSEPAVATAIPASATTAPVEPTQAAPATVIAAPAPVEPPKTLRLPDLQGRKVVAATANDYTPLQFVDPATGKAVGWEYDAVNEICRRLNCTVDWQTTNWDSMIAAVKDGQFDVGMDGITINDERKQQVDFSVPYMTSQQFMLVRADESRFSDAKSFAADPELLVGSQAGTTNFYTAVYEVLDGNEQNPRIKLFETFGAAVQALLSDDVDTVLMDAASSQGYVGANPDKLKVVGGPLGSEDFGFIFTPKSDLVAPFNQAIEGMRADGFLDHLNSRWFFLYDPTSK
jgi:polar amino acid transport system substrate-binding protein